MRSRRPRRGDPDDIHTSHPQDEVQGADYYVNLDESDEEAVQDGAVRIAWPSSESSGSPPRDESTDAAAGTAASGGGTDSFGASPDVAGPPDAAAVAREARLAERRRRNEILAKLAAETAEAQARPALATLRRLAEPQVKRRRGEPPGAVKFEAMKLHIESGHRAHKDNARFREAIAR